MLSATSNPLIYVFYISVNFCIDGLSVIIPVLSSRLQNRRFRSKEESLRLGSYHTEDRWRRFAFLYYNCAWRM